jgi:hypothetical protein
MMKALKINRPIRFRSLKGAGLGLLIVLGFCGCLDEPEIDERWTLLEFLAADPAPGQTVAGTGAVAVTVSGRITYRAIRTGFLVIEARYSPTLNAAAAALDPEEHTLATARRVAQVLDNSVSAGRGIKAVTGFDHLMQQVDLEFDAMIPADLFTGSPDSVAGRGMFLVMYLAEGDEIEVEGGRDSLVVTPFDVEATEVLFTGFALNPLDPAAGSSP